MEPQLDHGHHKNRGARSSDKTASGQISRGRVVPNVIVTVVIVILIEVIGIVVILAKAMACR
jgi:hypothetical protein